MRTSAIGIIAVLIFWIGQIMAQTSPEDQIRAAVQAAPEEAQQGARVYGYDIHGKLITLREGTNDFIVMADDPNREGFEIVCYHKALEPFMARGRALKAEGKSFKEIFDIREKEARAGTLKMPEQPSTMHIYFGKEARFHPETGQIEGARYRYVVYVPFATQESTGLSLKPNAPGHPWLMNPGTHRAHIMITPPGKG